MATVTPEMRAETNGPLVTTIACAFGAIAVLFTILRFYTRGVILKALGKDDWAILVATLLSLVNSVAMVMEVKYGMGRHQVTIGPQEGLEQLKFLMVAILHYNMGMNVVKLGFLFQFKRIFQDGIIQTICFWSIIYVCFWAVVQAALLIFACLPIGIIVPSMADKCLDTLPIWYLSSGMSMATDIAIFCIPLPSVWKLQLPMKQKMMVMGIFCLGFFVCIVSVYRMFTLRSGVVSTDPSWENIGAAIWSCIEINVSIVASSLGTLRPLLARLLPSLGLSRASKDRSAYLRYGGSTLASPRSTNFSGIGGKGGGLSSSGNRRGRAASISTEELALGDLTPGSIAASMYANASSDHSQGGYGSEKQNEQHNAGRIVRTTEISVQTGDR